MTRKVLDFYFPFLLNISRDLKYIALVTLFLDDIQYNPSPHLGVKVIILQPPIIHDDVPAETVKTEA